MAALRPDQGAAPLRPTRRAPAEHGGTQHPDATRKGGSSHDQEPPEPQDRTPCLGRSAPAVAGRDLFDSKAFTAATRHPFEHGDLTPPCTDEDPELFWPATESEAALAKAVCRGCPLIRSCLGIARERGEWGVWGGELLAKGRVTTELPGNVRPSTRDKPRIAWMWRRLAS